MEPNYFRNNIQTGVPMTVLVKDGFTDAIKDGKLVHTSPTGPVDDKILNATLSNEVMLQLYHRMYSDKDYFALMNEGWNSQDYNDFVAAYNNKTLSYTVYMPKDVNNALSDYMQFSWNPVTDNYVVVRVPDADLDPSQDFIIFHANGINVKYVKQGNTLYVFTSINRSSYSENQLRWLYLDPFFFLTSYEKLPTKVISWDYVGSKGINLTVLSGFACAGTTTNGGVVSPYITFNPPQK